MSVTFLDDSDLWLKFYNTGSTQVLLGTSPLTNFGLGLKQRVKVRVIDNFGLFAESQLTIEFGEDK